MLSNSIPSQKEGKVENGDGEPLSPVEDVLTATAINSPKSLSLKDSDPSEVEVSCGVLATLASTTVGGVDVGATDGTSTVVGAAVCVNPETLKVMMVSSLRISYIVIPVLRIDPNW